MSRELAASCNTIKAAKRPEAAKAPLAAASSNLVTRTSKTQSVRKSTLRFCFYLVIGKNKTQSIIKTLCVSVCRLKEAPDGNDQYSRPNLR